MVPISTRPASGSLSSDDTQRGQLISHIIRAIHAQLTVLHDILFNISAQPERIPYHTSVFSGHQWVLELISDSSHPKRILAELGLSKVQFLLLVNELRSMGLEDTRNVTLEEQVAIFLYICITGLTTVHVGERFQRSNDTITR